jgi:ribosomal protein L11 methyltransferase
LRKQQSLWQVSVATSPEAEDAVVELLAGIFKRAAVVFADAEKRSSVASVYCERRSEWTPARHGELMRGLRGIKAAGLDIGPGRISARRVAREDWAESWKRHFKAIEIGARLLVKPGWIKRRPRTGQAVVVLDPGLSFGTGNHPTTAFCLKALAEFRRPGARQSCWDVGTGSGILAIAAAKLGYAPVRAMDFDEEAVRAARENARRNRVRIQIGRQDITRLPGRGGKHDFICANLMADLLVSQCEKLVSRLRPGGALALAGILRAEFSRVRRAYEAEGLRLRESRIEGEWRSGVFSFRKATDGRGDATKI